MCSSQKPDIVSGKANERINAGNAEFVSSERESIVPARNRAIPSSAQPYHWGAGLPPDFLALAGIGSWNIVRRRSRRRKLSGVYFPGTVVLILLFTAIFATISIIEDRKEGFLQAVLVAPIPRSSFVFGKMLGATTLAVIQGVLFMLLAPLVGFSWTMIPAALLMLTLVAFSLTGLGYVIAWKMDSTQGFHAIMNVLLISDVAAVRSRLPCQKCLVLAEGGDHGESSDLRSGSRAVVHVRTGKGGNHGSSIICIVPCRNGYFRADDVHCVARPDAAPGIIRSGNEAGNFLFNAIRCMFQKDRTSGHEQRSGFHVHRAQLA